MSIQFYQDDLIDEMRLWKLHTALFMNNLSLSYYNYCKKKPEEVSGGWLTCRADSALFTRGCE